MAVASIRNHDVLTLMHLLNRFINEIGKSQSSTGSDVREADRERLTKYLEAVKAYRDWVVNEPQLDCPSTHPTEYPVPLPPTYPDILNESLKKLMSLYALAREELLASQSAKVASGLETHDLARFDAILTKIGSFMVDYIDKVAPVDFPERGAQPSTPMA